MQKATPTHKQKIVQEDNFIVSKTDLQGRIIYGNKYFIEISGYSESELLYQPHSILRHPDMPKIIFKLLWQRIQNKKEIFAYVKNLCKDGSFYWVFANVTATLDEDGNIRDFHSVRRKASDKALSVIQKLYEQLLSVEATGGIEASQRLLDEILQDKGVSYDKFIFSL